MSDRRFSCAFVLICFALGGPVLAQSPSVIYTWDASGNPVGDIEGWSRSSGADNTSATLTNTTAGRLTITETSSALGLAQSFKDDPNRIRESSISATGGLDLTGLGFVDFDMGHNGTGSVPVDFFAEAGPDGALVILGRFGLFPGFATYRVGLQNLTPDQKTYIRTLGFNIHNHAIQGNLVWSLHEVRSVAAFPAPTQRQLASFDSGSADGGLQGMIINFDNSSVAGNTGQNQTGLLHNPAGSGSIQWTDVAGGAGAAVSVGNGLAWNGNTFNDRDTDVSNFKAMIVRISATDLAGGGGSIDLNAFFQTNNFSQFQQPEAGATRSIPIDGQFHDVVWLLTGLTNLNLIEQTGINLSPHPQDLVINIDSITFVPEPTVMCCMALACLMLRRKKRCGKPHPTIINSMN